MPRIRMPLLILLVLAGAMIALWDSPPESLQQKPRSAKQIFPSAYMLNPKTRQFGESGLLQYEFTASRVEYFEPSGHIQDNYATATNPKIIFYSEKQNREDAPRKHSAPWHIRALKSRTTNGGETITFTGKVVIWQQDKQGEYTELHTEKLVVKPNDEYAETDKTVKISTPESTTEAVGLQVFIKQNRLLLLSKVRSKITHVNTAQQSSK